MYNLVKAQPCTFAEARLVLGNSGLGEMQYVAAGRIPARKLLYHSIIACGMEDMCMGCAGVLREVMLLDHASALQRSRLSVIIFY